MAQYKVRHIRIDALSKILELDLGPRDIPWLTGLLGESDYFGAASPIAWSALPAGGLTPRQEAGIVEHLALSFDLRTPWRAEWQHYATLGKAWSTWSTEIEDWISNHEKEVRSTTDGWFEARKRIRGLQLLLNAVKAK